MSSNSSVKTHETAQIVKKRTCLSKIVKFLNKVVNLTGELSKYLAGIFVTAMLILTFADVFLRYLFNKPIDGSLELTEFMMALLVVFGMVYCAFRKGHIRIDLVTEHLPKKYEGFDRICHTCLLKLYNLVQRQFHRKVAVHAEKTFYQNF